MVYSCEVIFYSRTPASDDTSGFYFMFNCLQTYVTRYMKGGVFEIY